MLCHHASSSKFCLLSLNSAPCLWLLCLKAVSGGSQQGTEAQIWPSQASTSYVSWQIPSTGSMSDLVLPHPAL